MLVENSIRVRHACHVVEVGGGVRELCNCKSCFWKKQYRQQLVLLYKQRVDTSNRMSLTADVQSTTEICTQELS